MRFQKFNRFDPAKPIRFYDAPNDGGGGTGTGNNADNNAGGGNDKPANDGRKTQEQIQQAVQAEIEALRGKNNNDDAAVLRYLVQRTHGLEQQRDDAKKSALSKEDRAFLEAAKALGKTPAELAAIMNEHGSWAEERARTAKTESLKKAATVAGLNADLLASLDGAMGVEYVTTGDGDKAVATVKYKDGDKEVVKPLGDWAKEKWPALEVALKADGQQHQPARTVTKFGKSAPANTGSTGKTVWDEMRDKRKGTADATPAKSWQEQVGVRPPD